MAGIKACKIWNKTPFILTEGMTYRFSATGNWKDWTKDCTVIGYDSDKLRLFESSRRMKEAKWFSLVGALDKAEDSYFDIGKLIETGGTYTADRSGTLYCFANDVIIMYWNNSGEIDLEMTMCT